MANRDQARQPDISRRTALKGAMAGGVVLGAPWVWRKASAQGKRIVIRDPGGPFTVAFAEAFYKPFQAATGIEAVGVASAHEPTSQIKSMVDTKTYTWDMALLSQAAADQLVKEGEYIEKIGLDSHPDVTEIRAEFRTPYCYGNDVYTALLAYRTDAFKGRKPPTSWKDLWDVAGVPGRRAIRKHPFDTTEEALLADGVPKDKLYPCDVDRAFRSLDKIKKNVAVWWTGGAQTSQMLKSGEVDMIPTWNARAQAAIDDGAPAAMAWDQGLWAVEGWSILARDPERRPLPRVHQVRGQCQAPGGLHAAPLLRPDQPQRLPVRRSEARLDPADTPRELREVDQGRLRVLGEQQGQDHRALQRLADLLTSRSPHRPSRGTPPRGPARRPSRGPEPA